VAEKGDTQEVFGFAIKSVVKLYNKLSNFMKEENKKYLQEDEDLLSKLQEIGPVSTGQALSQQDRIISIIQIESILRNRKSMVDMDKSTTLYSKILGIFAIIQITIAGFQLVLGIKESPDQSFAIFIGGVFIAILCWIIKQMNSVYNSYNSNK